MIISLVTSDESVRVYATRHASVVTYFDEAADGTTVLHVEPGFLAYPDDFARKQDAVAASVLDEIARRLGIFPDEVLRQPFARLAAITDPELPDHYRITTRRSRSRRSF